jgi:hypothetical protein
MTFPPLSPEETTAPRLYAIANLIGVYLNRQDTPISEMTAIGLAEELNTQGVLVGDPPSDGLRERIARRIRDAVRLRYGPNARDILERGGEVCMNSGEADMAASAALAEVQADLDAKDAEIGGLHRHLDENARELSETLRDAERVRALCARAKTDGWEYKLSADIVLGYLDGSLLPEREHAALDQAPAEEAGQR